MSMQLTDIVKLDVVREAPGNERTAGRCDLPIDQSLVFGFRKAILVAP